MVRISDGNNKQGFPMRQGVLTPGRVCLLCRVRGVPVRDQGGLEGGSACLFMGSNLSALNLVTVRKKRKIFMD